MRPSHVRPQSSRQKHIAPILAYLAFRTRLLVKKGSHHSSPWKSLGKGLLLRLMYVKPRADEEEATAWGKNDGSNEVP
jgi:hypothetical protein